MSSNFELYEDYLHSTSGVEFCKDDVLSCERSCLLLLQLVEIKHLEVGIVLFLTELLLFTSPLEIVQ